MKIMKRIVLCLTLRKNIDDQINHGQGAKASNGRNYLFVVIYNCYSIQSMEPLYKKAFFEYLLMYLHLF